ncbi:hypothetical protein SNEBB_002928 [Seison nebaliae]|nr:hypothetical protein SNEBB_002928 [Seison nebaliae]
MTKTSKKLASLPFLPPKFVISTFEVICQQEVSENNYELLEYFKQNYIGTIDIRGQLVNNLFPLKFWNHYHNVMEKEKITNNVCESFNNYINNLTNASHVGLFRLIEILSKIETYNELRMKEIDGMTPIRSTKKSLTERILPVLEEYEEDQDVEKLLESIHLRL